ncbi:MAG: hypothetical protein D6728_17690, partial [Cyanobacteria bacterium J055]
GKNDLDRPFSGIDSESRSRTAKITQTEERLQAKRGKDYREFDRSEFPAFARLYWGRKGGVYFTPYTGECLENRISFATLDYKSFHFRSAIVSLVPT